MVSSTGLNHLISFYKKVQVHFGQNSIQLIRKVKDGGKEKFKRLDFSKGEIRQKVLAMQTPDELDHLFDTDGFFE